MHMGVHCIVLCHGLEVSRWMRLEHTANISRPRVVPVPLLAWMVDWTCCLQDNNTLVLFTLTAINALHGIVRNGEPSPYLCCWYNLSCDSEIVVVRFIICQRQFVRRQARLITWRCCLVIVVIFKAYLWSLYFLLFKIVSTIIEDCKSIIIYYLLIVIEVVLLKFDSIFLTKFYSRLSKESLFSRHFLNIKNSLVPHSKPASTYFIFIL